MSEVLINPDGTLAIHLDGTLVLADEDAPCCCLPRFDGCPRAWRFARCTPVDQLCIPDSPMEVYVCGTFRVFGSPDWPPEFDGTLDEIIARGLRPVAKLGDVCYSLENMVGPHATTPLVELVPPGSCETEVCNRDRCRFYVRISPCFSGGNAGDVFVPAGSVLPGGAVLIGNPGVCYCLRAVGPPIEEQDLPPGAVIVDTSVGYLSCCECLVAQFPGLCTVARVDEWTGEPPTFFRERLCCCGPISEVLVTGEATVTVNLGPGQPEGQPTVIVNRTTITGAVFCPDRGTWALVWTEEVWHDGALVSSNPGGGCFRDGYTGRVVEIPTECGAWIQTGPPALRNPFASPLNATFGAFEILVSGCDSWSERYRFRVDDPDNTGAFNETSGVFSVRVIRTPGPCIDSCQLVLGPAGAPIMAGPPRPCCGGDTLPGEVQL